MTKSQPRSSHRRFVPGRACLGLLLLAIAGCAESGTAKMPPDYQADRDQHPERWVRYDHGR